MPTRSPRPRILVAAAVLLAVTACSSGTDGPDTTDATDTTTSVSPTTPGGGAPDPTPSTVLPPFDEEAAAAVTPPPIPPLEVDWSVEQPRNVEVPLPVVGPGVTVVLPPGVDPGRIDGTTPEEVIEQIIGAIVEVQPTPGPLPDHLADVAVGDLEPWALPDPEQRSVSCALVNASGLEALLGEHRIFQDSEMGIGNCFGESLVGNSRAYLRLGYLAADTPVPPPYEGMTWQRSDYGGIEVYSTVRRGVTMALAVRDGLAIHLTVTDEAERLGDREGLVAAMAAVVVARLDVDEVKAEIERFAEMMPGADGR